MTVITWSDWLTLLYRIFIVFIPVCIVLDISGKKGVVDDKTQSQTSKEEAATNPAATSCTESRELKEKAKITFEKAQKKRRDK